MKTLSLKKHKSLRSKAMGVKKVTEASLIGGMVNDYLMDPQINVSWTYINCVFAYFLFLAAVAGVNFEYWMVLVYFPPVYYFYNWRLKITEKERLVTAHSIPFFADALANGLSVGMTLEQAFEQSAYYLKGKIKIAFNELMIKNALGIELGGLLRRLDERFPNTGLSYMISLLEEYHDLGVGISPLLKKIAEALTVKEESEEKIRTILAAGSSYARMSIGMFVFIFLALSLMLRDQITKLFSPQLKPYFIFLIVWAAVGIFVMSRITGMEFAKTFALRSFTQHFLEGKKLTVDDLMDYSGFDWSPWKKNLYHCMPIFGGFAMTYVFSLYATSMGALIVGYLVGGIIAYKLAIYVLKGLVEDQLVRTVETFPDVLRVFVIGLNAGLNTIMALQFAKDSVKESAPRLLMQELTRVKFAMECGEKHSVTWQRFAEKLPFQTIIDFCEIMVIAPTHGESIVHEVIQMTNGYQVKKMTLIEKKAVTLGQIVIPIIVLSFFPLFLFFVFAPLFIQVNNSVR